MKMPRIIAIAVVSIVLSLSFADAQEADVAESRELPVVRMTEASITFWTRLAGSMRILWSPDTFGEYWPDYGYSWENARSGTGCNDLNATQRRASIGRVALVFSPMDSKEYVGFDLTDRLSSDPDIIDVQRNHGEEITQQHLCTLLTREQASHQLESDIYREIYPWLTGNWTISEIDKESEYVPIGSGTVVDGNENTDPRALTWTGQGNTRLAWQAPGSDASIPSNVLWKFESGDSSRPTYYLEWEPAQGETADVVRTFQVDDTGTIDVLIKDGSYRLWAEKHKSSGIVLPIPESGDWWLVTEHTLPNSEMEVGIRTLPARNFK